MNLKPRLLFIRSNLETTSKHSKMRELVCIDRKRSCSKILHWFLTYSCTLQKSSWISWWSSIKVSQKYRKGADLTITVALLRKDMSLNVIPKAISLKAARTAICSTQRRSCQGSEDMTAGCDQDMEAGITARFPREKVQSEVRKKSWDRFHMQSRTSISYTHPRKPHLRK